MANESRTSTGIVRDRKMTRILKPLYLVGKRVLPESVTYGSSLGSRLVNFIMSCLRAVLRTECVVIEGHTMFLDPEDAIGLSVFGIQEPFETELIKRIVGRGDTVLDIGAHVGYYTLILARLVGPEGKVFAFEPEPKNFELLERNVRVNGYENVILVQKAVSSGTCKTALHLSRSSRTHSLIDFSRLNKQSEYVNSIEVEAVKLDDYFSNYDGVVNFVKMDIEGCEGEAIAGMLSLLEKNRSLAIIFEFNPILDESGTTPCRYLDTIVNQGFELFRINEQKWAIEPVNVSYLLEHYGVSRGRFTNLLCLRDPDGAHRLHGLR